MKTSIKSSAIIIAVASVMAGCSAREISPAPNQSSAAPDTANASQSQRDLAKKSVDAINKGCKYIAAINPILKIVMKSLPGLSTVEDIRQAVCEAAKQAATIEGKGSIPTVGGVPIEGQFRR